MSEDKHNHADRPQPLSSLPGQAEALAHPEAMFDAGAELHRQGDIAGAERLYRAVLARTPTHFEALNLLGIINLQTARQAEAIALFERAIEIDPEIPAAHSNLGAALREMGRSDDAVLRFDRAIALDPNYADAHYNRGAALLDLNRPQEALASFDKTLDLEPGSADTHFIYGNALKALGLGKEAVARYEQTLRIDPHFAAAYNNCGVILQDLARHEEALKHFDSALNIDPDYIDAYVNRASVLLSLKRAEDALADADRALHIDNGNIPALNNRAGALRMLNRPGEALACYDHALARDPQNADLHGNRGNALRSLGRPLKALDSYDRALALNPDFPDALAGRGGALSELKRHDEAATTYARLLALSPGYDYALGNFFHARLQSCDWTDYNSLHTRVAAAVENGERAEMPFPFLAHSDSAAQQLKCARIFVSNTYPPAAMPLSRPKHRGHDKIRLAYLSADFNAHPVANLAAGLFEAHDLSRFETTAISFGIDDQSAMRQRLQNAFQHFVDVRGQSDRDVAKLLHDREIDIAVDLSGHTKGARAGILAHRGAPVQVNYLGYPGTMGADYVDYIVADRHVIPPGYENYCTEKVVRLPGAYQANDRKRKIGDDTPPRTAQGLPENGFVFCCFNNNYKITPAIFDIWMRLLKQVDGSVLWLLEDNVLANRNIVREAQKRGVTAGRIVFAPRMATDAHLARHRRADLFLDTLPYNAHTTASDALWTGLPLVTCMGNSFASRVAGSLLHAIGLPELVTHTLADYESLALKLATTPDLLANIKAKLACNRDTQPLFDTNRFCRAIESAYTIMVERSRRGEPPAAFDILQ